MPLKWTRSDWLVILLFAILILLFHWRVLTPNLADRQSFPPGDFSHQFWAFAAHEARELQAGRLPLWNPYTFAGAPFWADVQSAVFYPPSLLTILLTAPWGFSLFALEVEAIAHVWLAAIFMYLFVRALTHHRPAALMAALNFTFSGYLTGYPSQQLAVLETDVWLPLILYFQVKAVHHRQAQLLTSPYLILAGVAWGLALLAGHPQSAFIVAIVSIIYFGFLIHESRRLSVSQSGSTGSPRRQKLRRLSLSKSGSTDSPRDSSGSADVRREFNRRPKFWVLLHSLYFFRSGTAKSAAQERQQLKQLHSDHRNAQFWEPSNVLAYLLPIVTYLTIGLALAAIQFIPAFEYTRLSVRAAGTYAAMSGGFPFVDMLQVVLPGLLTTYSPLYVSMVGLLLALTATFGRHEHQRQTTFWAMGGFIALLISFGGNSFLYSPLYLSIPGFAIFRGQERWAFAVSFSLCVLVGYGFKAVMGHRANILGRISRDTRYLFIFMMLLLAASFYGLNDTGWQAENPFYKLLSLSTFLSLILGLAWLLWQLTPQLSTPMLTGLTAFLLCLDLFSLSWQTNLYPQLPEWHTKKPTIVQTIQADAAAESLSPHELRRLSLPKSGSTGSTDDSLRRYGTSAPHEFRVYNEYRLYDNYGVAFQLEDLWGASPLRPLRYDQFIQPLPIEAGWKLELLNVKYVITWREQLGYLPSTVIHQEPAPDGLTYVHRLKEQRPRAWLVHQIELVDDESILQKLADPTFNPWQVALVEKQLMPTLKESLFKKGGNQLGTGVKKISYHSPQSISIEAETAAPGLLILSEPYYPGWQATVNGQAAPIERANYLLRAIPLPAGKSQVELTFRPPTFIIGAGISGLTLVVISLSLILAYRQSLQNGAESL